MAAVIVLAALMSAGPGHAATPGDAPRASSPKVFDDARAGGKSFLDHLTAIHVEEPSYPLPATFQAAASATPAFAAPLAAPRREPEPFPLVLASLGLLVYLGRRRRKALAATS